MRGVRVRAFAAGLLVAFSLPVVTFAIVGTSVPDSLRSRHVDTWFRVMSFAELSAGADTMRVVQIPGDAERCWVSVSCRNTDSLLLQPVVFSDTTSGGVFMGSGTDSTSLGMFTGPGSGYYGRSFPLTLPPGEWLGVRLLSTASATACSTLSVRIHWLRSSRKWR